MAKAVLDVEVRDERFKSLERAFEKFRKAAEKTPQTFKLIESELSNVEKSMTTIKTSMDRTDNSMRAVAQSTRTFSRDVADARKNMEGTAKASRQVTVGTIVRGQIAGAVASSAIGATAKLPVVGGIVSGAITGGTLGMAGGPWGMLAGGIVGAIIGGIKDAVVAAKDTAMTLTGQADPYGLNAFAGNAANERRWVYGLGGMGGGRPGFMGGYGYGGIRAFQNVYGRVADTSAMLNARTEAVTDPTSGAFQTYLQMGVDPYIAQPGEASRQLLERIRERAKALPESMLGPMLMRPFGLQRAGIDMQTVLRARNLPEEEWKKFQEKYATRKEGMDVHDTLMENMQDFDTQVKASAKILETGIVNIIGPKLVPELTAMSEQLTNLSDPGGIIHQLTDVLTSLVKAGRGLLPAAPGTTATVYPTVPGQPGQVNPSMGPAGLPDFKKYGSLPWNLKDDLAYLEKLGMTPEQAQGVVANLGVESGGIYTQWQHGGGPGYGLAQWSPERRAQFAAAHGGRTMDDPRTTRREQLDWIMQEARADPAHWGSFLTAKTAEEATEKFRHDFESPKDEGTGTRGYRQRVIVELRQTLNLPPGATVSTQSNAGR